MIDWLGRHTKSRELPGYPLFVGLSAITLLSIFVGIAADLPVLMVLPFLALGAYLTILDFRIVFFFLLAAIPLSTELMLPGGFGLDFPDEPLMLLLTGVFMLYAARHANRLSGAFFRHPITILLGLHFLWLMATAITSSEQVVSIKFLLAKVWYITAFYLMAGQILRTDRDMRRFLWWVLIPMLITVLWVLGRHAGYGFSFADVNRVLNPFYRNHVAYACILALFVPYVWFGRFWYPKGSWQRNFLIGAFLLLLIAIQLSYTRAAYISLIGAVGAYFIIRWKLVKVVLLAGLIGALGFAGSMWQQSKYLEYAPDFDRTVTHYEFDNLIEATAKGEDISTMERVYRWVAGLHMISEKPVFGFGPGNFYNFYHSYTVTSFETYVSDNPEKSGIHSYYLMTVVEQGFPGLLFFLALSFFVLIRAEQLYHLAPDAWHQRQIMLFVLSYIVILILCLINDLVETDKVGSFFFINMAMIVNMDIRLKRMLQQSEGT
jgi:O-antigen ligase